MRLRMVLAVASALLAGCAAPSQPLSAPGEQLNLRSEAWEGSFTGSGTTGGYYDMAYALAISAPTLLNLTVVLTDDGFGFGPAELRVSLDAPDGEDLAETEGPSPVHLTVPVQSGPHGVWVRWARDTVEPGQRLYRAQATWLEPAR